MSDSDVSLVELDEPGEDAPVQQSPARQQFGSSGEDAQPLSPSAAPAANSWQVSSISASSWCSRCSWRAARCCCARRRRACVSQLRLCLRCMLHQQQQQL